MQFIYFIFVIFVTDCFAFYQQTTSYFKFDKLVQIRKTRQRCASLKIPDMDKTLNAFSKTALSLHDLPIKSLFIKSIYAGSFVGFGGILAASVGFDLGLSPWISGGGLRRLLCGIIGFPLANMLMILTGIVGWSGDVIAFFSMATYSGINTSSGSSISVMQCIRVLIVSYIGCLLGAIITAGFANFSGLPAIGPLVRMASHKFEWNALQVLFRSILGGVLVCLAIVLSKHHESASLECRLLIIWLLVSAQVICDLEHCLGSMFIIPAAILAGLPVTVQQVTRLFLLGMVGNLLGIALTLYGLTVQLTRSTLPSKPKKETILSYLFDARRPNPVAKQ